MSSNAIPQRPEVPISEENFDQEFTGSFPRYSGAISEVTGGPPEDMNEMPANDHPECTPIYDGSDLGAKKENCS
jgi:hypothetical protein